MNKPIDIKSIQKEVVSSINNLKASRDTTKGERSKEHLLEIRETLQKYIRTGHHNLNVLRKDTSGELQKVKEIAVSEIDKIKMIIMEIDSALNSFLRTNTGAGNSNDTNFMNSAKEGDLLQLTYQTIAIIEAEHYRTAGQEYPRPVLGLSVNPRDCNITDKILIGSMISGRGRRPDCRIAIPKFFQKFCGGRD